MCHRNVSLLAFTALAASIAAVTASSPSRGQGAARPDSGVGPPMSPRLVDRVYLQPLDAAPDGRNARLRVDLGARSSSIFPRLSRIGESSTSTGGLTRSVSIDLASMAEGQANYARDIAGGREVVEFIGREASRRTSNSGTSGAPAFKIGQEVALAQFQGSPALAPAEEARLISHCLMITDLGVVEDPERTTGLGRWTFGQLMTRLANEKETGIRPADFVKRWLSSWVDDQTIDGFTVPNRKDGIQSKIIDPWPKLANGDLDLTQSPFRLLAIIGRLDLRNNLVLGAERIGGGGAGEARFVFGAVDAAKNPMPFTAIFEFGVKKNDFAGVRDWARQWYALKDLDLGSEEYNEALERITAQFANAGTDPESPPNRSALSQLRTNEIALTLPPPGQPPAPGQRPLWEVREFRIDAQNAGFLRQVTAKQTPDLSLNRAQVVADFINSHEAAILAQRHRTPVDFPSGTPMLAGAAATPPNTFWDGPPGAINQGDARHLFSLGTCNGCHSSEAFPKLTAPDDLSQDVPPPHFTQVRPRQAGKEARLSAFLTGKNPDGTNFLLDDPAGQPDPDDSSKVKKRAFADLHRRALDLRDLIRYGVFYECYRLPLQMTH